MTKCSALSGADSQMLAVMPSDLDKVASVFKQFAPEDSGLIDTLGAGRAPLRALGTAAWRIQSG